MLAIEQAGFPGVALVSEREGASKRRG